MLNEDAKNTGQRLALGKDTTADSGRAARPLARGRLHSLWSAVASQAPSPHAPVRGAEAAELRPGYNWSLAWSLSASGLTVWPGEGAWGGWDTGGRPWDRDMALGTMPSTAVGMPLGATPTTPGGYL